VDGSGAPAGSSEPGPTTERRPAKAADGETPVADPAVPATPPADRASGDGATPATPPNVVAPTTSVNAGSGASATPGAPLAIARAVAAEQALLMANANAQPLTAAGGNSQTAATTDPVLLLQNEDATSKMLSRAAPLAQGPGAAPNAAAHLATTGVTGLDLSVTRRPDWAGTPQGQATTATARAIETMPLIPAQLAASQPAVAAQSAGMGHSSPSGLPFNDPALAAPDGNTDILDDNLRQIALRAQIHDFVAKPAPAATATNTPAATAILSAGGNADGAAGSGQQVGAPSLASAVLASIQAETGDTGGQTGRHGGTRQTPLPITEAPIILADGTAAGPASPAGSSPNALGDLLGTQRADVANTGRPAPLPGAMTEQVAIQIASAVRTGMRHITMQMKPASLGEVDVELSIGRDGQVRALVLAERADTLDLLQRDARSLERALQDAGLKSDSGSLSFGLRGEGRGGDGDGGRAHGSAAIGSAIDDEGEAAMAAQLAYARSGADGHALDIRV
jgi:hypothetical protein